MQKQQNLFPIMFPARLKPAKLEIQKLSTCRAILFRCKFWSMFCAFHLAWSTWSATKTSVAGWWNAARWLVDLLGHEQIWANSSKLRVFVPRIKAAKYETQKHSTCRATLFPCKFWSMFRVFHLACSTWPATKNISCGLKKYGPLIGWFARARANLLRDKLWVWLKTSNKANICRSK